MYTWGYIKNCALAKLDLSPEEANNQGFVSKFIYYANEVITQVCSTYKPDKKYFYIEVDSENIYHLISMPDDFISFNDDVSYVIIDGVKEECTDFYYSVMGYNKITFNEIGVYMIPYNSRWITFSHDLKDTDVLDVPTDILECIPSYIAHQCYKVDDEYKSSVFRNEYEMFLARIDDSNYTGNKSIKIGGNW